MIARRHSNQNGLEHKSQFYVGCEVVTSKGERGRVVSINGPSHHPVIVVARRLDIDCDDVGFFSLDGRLGGCSSEYRITPAKSR